MSKTVRGNKIEVVFWLRNYPRSISGTIDYFSIQNDFKVFCICDQKKIPHNRVGMGWEYDNLENVEFIYLSDYANPNYVITSFLEKLNNPIHIYGGFRAGNIARIVKNHLFIKKKKNNIIIISERPYYYNAGLIKKSIMFLCYWIYYIRYNKYISLYFAMGRMGVDAFKKIGWKSDKLYPFIYHKKYPAFSTRNFNNITFPIKVLYVGQFDKRKGVDLICEASTKFNKGEFEFNFVGRNGNLYDETIEWIRNAENCNYLGVWDESDLSQKIKDYDLCVVPSRFDGWGMFTLESILAGVGVITTDETGSKDLVLESNAGIVIESNSIDSITNVLKSIHKDPCVLIEWNRNALKYKEKLSDDVIGSSMRKIIMSKIFNEHE